MNNQRIITLTNRMWYVVPRAVFATKGPVCPEPKEDDGTGPLKRAMKSGKVRFGFIPDNWFKFFYTKTGVTGPYLFGIMLLNYLLSKEKYVMEHEYYTGISIFLMVYYATKNFGPPLAQYFDKEIDDVEAAFTGARNAEEKMYVNIIKNCKDRQLGANGQKLLMNAKKENVAMQLEAAYRERLMLVFKTVKRRLEYQMKRYRAVTQIQQKWMTAWILNQVLKAITPEVEKKAIDQAIADLTAIANRAKK